MDIYGIVIDHEGGEIGDYIYFKEGDALSIIKTFIVNYDVVAGQIVESERKFSIHPTIKELLNNMYYSTKNIVNGSIFSFYYKYFKIYNLFVFGLMIGRYGVGWQGYKKIYAFYTFDKLNGKVIYDILHRYLNEDDYIGQNKQLFNNALIVKFVDIDLSNGKVERKEESINKFMYDKLSNIKDKNFDYLVNNPFLGVIEKIYAIANEGEFLVVDSDHIPFTVLNLPNEFRHDYRDGISSISKIQSFSKPHFSKPQVPFRKEKVEERNVSNNIQLPLETDENKEINIEIKIVPSTRAETQILSGSNKNIEQKVSTVRALDIKHALMSTMLLLTPVWSFIELMWNLFLVFLYKYMEQPNADMWKFFLIRFGGISIILFVSLLYLIFLFYFRINVKNSWTISSYDYLRYIYAYAILLIVAHGMFIYFDFSIAVYNISTLFYILFIMMDSLIFIGSASLLLLHMLRREKNEKDGIRIIRTS